MTVDLDCQQSQQPELLLVKIWTFPLQPSHGVLCLFSCILRSQKHYKNKNILGEVIILRNMRQLTRKKII